MDVLRAAWALRRRYPCSVTSWFRSPTHNREVGGVARSKHQTGQAVDVVYDGVRPPLEDVEAACAPFAVRVVRESDHDHLQTH